MSAEIIQFVPRPNPDRERKLAEEAAKILTPFVETVGFTDTSPCVVPHYGKDCPEPPPEAPYVPYRGAGIDGMVFPDNDPA